MREQQPCLSLMHPATPTQRINSRPRITILLLYSELCQRKKCPLPCGDQTCLPRDIHPNIPASHLRPNVPRFPLIVLPHGAVPPTGTEMKARPFGLDAETGTGATPEIHSRGTEAGVLNLSWLHLPSLKM